MYSIANRINDRAAAVRENLKGDRGEVNIVATVLLIVIAVTLVIFFREAIEGWIRDLVGTIGDGVSSNNDTKM